MTAAQLRSLRAALDLSQADLGRLLYLSEDNCARTIRRWENDEVAITGPAQKALELIAKERRIRIR